MYLAEQSKENITVNTSIGICECFIGCDGSPCAHQFTLWSENIADSVNLVPFTSTDEPLYSSAQTEVDAVDWTFLVKIMTFQVR